MSQLALGIDSRALRVAWTVFLFLAALALVYAIGHTLIVFTLAIFLAHLLGPVVERVETTFPSRISRTWALAAVYLILLAIVTTVLVTVGAQVGSQAATLAARLPETLQSDPLARIPLPMWLEEQRPQLTEMLRERVQELDAAIIPALERLGAGLLTGLGNVLAAILIPILAFFFLKDGHELRAALVGSFSPQHRPVVTGIFSDLHVLLVQYIRALVLLAILVFLTHAAFFELTGVPYGILLATIAAFLEFIPIAGPLVAAVVVIVVALFTGYDHPLWIAVFLGVFRLFQDYVVNPHLMSSGIALHPLLVLFGVLAGEQVAGIPGMFFSVPVMAAFRILIRRLHHA